MTRLLTACLLLLSCLATRPATAQAVVKLLPGDCLDRPFIGVDSATYYSTADYVAQARTVLDTRAARIAELERTNQTAAEQLATTEAELHRCRGEGKLDAVDFRTVAVAGQKLASKPPAPPLLLDGNTYKGIGIGGALVAVGGVLLKVFVFH